MLHSYNLRTETDPNRLLHDLDAMRPGTPLEGDLKQALQRALDEVAGLQETTHSDDAYRELENECEQHADDRDTAQQQLNHVVLVMSEMAARLDQFCTHTDLAPDDMKRLRAVIALADAVEGVE